MDKMREETGRLQAEIGGISDRKNAERDEELRKLQTRYEALLQEKDKAVAEITGDKVRAMSELVKMKGFISRVQAINAVLEKERQSLRVEKMQLAQSMASNMEDVKKSKSDLDALKTSHQAEIESLTKRHQADMQQFRAEHAAEFASGHAQQLAELQRRYQTELSSIRKKNQEEFAELINSNQEGIRELEKNNQEELAALAKNNREELQALAKKSQNELAAAKAAYAAELENKLAGSRAKYEAAAGAARAAAKKELELEYAAGLENKLAETRAKYEAAADGIRAGVRRELGLEYAAEIIGLKEALASGETGRAALEAESRLRAEEARGLEEKLSVVRKELEDSRAAGAEEHKRLEERLTAVMAEKADYEGRLSALDADRARLESESSRISGEYASAKAQLDAAVSAKFLREAELAKAQQDCRNESMNRERFESGLLSLRQKMQQLELQLKEAVGRVDTETQNFALFRDKTAKTEQADKARIDAMSAELEKYRQIEGSFAGRMKWTLKGKNEEGPGHLSSLNKE